MTYVPNKPILRITLEGKKPSLPSILLNCHYDVVPAVTECWFTDPFKAVEKDGKIYGRGIDLKIICIDVNRCIYMYNVYVCISAYI